MEGGKPTSPLDDLLSKTGGHAVIDGGLATQLEKHGADINDPIWSSICLIRNPDLIYKVHLEYLAAGADILVTSSYQATLQGFESKGIPRDEAESLLKKSVRLAVEARDLFWNSTEYGQNKDHNRALIAASVGSYGAYLADGSEYTGKYGDEVTLEYLKSFHRRRLQIFVEAGADLLAFETIPNKLEAQACVELLEEENVTIPSWICFSSVDGENAPSGDSFEECVEVINRSTRVKAMGINCAPPQFMNALIVKLNKLTDKLIVVYPNNGEEYDPRSKTWKPCECFNDESFGVMAKRWYGLGARLIGGCCRTTPSTVEAISRALKHSVA